MESRPAGYAWHFPQDRKRKKTKQNKTTKKKTAGCDQFKLFFCIICTVWFHLYLWSMILWTCMCVHAWVSQLDDECAEGGGVSVTDSVVNWPLSLEPNLEQHSPKSLNLLLWPNTHTDTHAHVRTDIPSWVCAISDWQGLVWQRAISSLSCVLITASSLLLPGRSWRGFTRHLWHTHRFYMQAYTLVTYICYLCYLVSYWFHVFKNIYHSFSKFFWWQSSHYVLYKSVCTIDYVRMKDFPTIVLHFFSICKQLNWRYVCTEVALVC